MEGDGNLPRRLYDMVAAGGVFSTAGSKGNEFGTFEYAPTRGRSRSERQAVIGFDRLDRKIDRVGVVLGRFRGVECGCAWAAFALGKDVSLFLLLRIERFGFLDEVRSRLASWLGRRLFEPLFAVVRKVYFFLAFDSLSFPVWAVEVCLPCCPGKLPVLECRTIESRKNATMEVPRG